jgi:hypothetical protein
MAPRSLFAALLACASLAVARKPTLEERGVPKDPTGILVLSNRLRFKLILEQVSGQSHRLRVPASGSSSRVRRVSARLPPV